MKIGYLIVLAILFTCCREKNISAEMMDKEILIQGMWQKQSEQVKIRIFPKMISRIDDDKKINEQMMFGIDSCFTKVIAGKRVYPIGVIPISNGVKNCYEYLLTFPKQEEDGEFEVLYQDKFINKKVYKLHFK